MFFITLQSLPSFLLFSKDHPLLRLRPRQVPLIRWCFQVLVLTAGSLLNNWVFAYKVPLTVQIVFRSGSTFLTLTHAYMLCVFKVFLGLAVSMLFGCLFLKKTYTYRQMVSH